MLYNQTGTRKDQPPLIPYPTFGELKLYSFLSLWEETGKKLNQVFKVRNEEEVEEKEEDDDNESYDDDTIKPNKVQKVLLQIFLSFSEPRSSILSVIHFFILNIFILLSIILMILGTIGSFNYSPTSCSYCDQSSKWFVDDDYSTEDPDSISCVCPPVATLDLFFKICFFYLMIEFIIRFLTYQPHPDTYSKKKNGNQKIIAYVFHKLLYLTRIDVIIDALSIFPYAIFVKASKHVTQGLLIVRLFSIFRIFRLYKIFFMHSKNVTYFLNVVRKSMVSLGVLLVFIAFGSIFFGSLVYFLEMGKWKYTTLIDPPSFTYMRKTVDGQSWEPTPYIDIPHSCWWFIVTATTVGYGGKTIILTSLHKLFLLFLFIRYVSNNCGW